MATTTQPAHTEAPQQGGLLRAALVIFVGLSLITGVLYPVVVTGIGKAAFPAQAGGSIIERGGKPVGSALIGQNFSEPQYFWGRLSATSPNPYNGAASSGSNLGPSNPTLTDTAKAAHRGAQGSRPRQYRADSGGPGHGFGQRAGSAYQPGRRCLSG